jgi:phosphopentomutase
VTASRTNRVERVLLVVCDSFGVGQALDAAAFGDEGSNTLGNCAGTAGGISAPNLESMGLGFLTPIEGVKARAEPGTAHGRLTERSAGKDTTTGHWELAGLVLDRPFPTYPRGFPHQVIRAFEERIGRPILGNKPASGTEIIEELGPDHLATGNPIVYTSGDSVFQIAAHKSVVPLERLYRWCRAARDLQVAEPRVGRLLARPIARVPGNVPRTPERRDFSVDPPGPMLLDDCLAAGVAVYGVGKIRDIFAGRGLTEWSYSDSNDHGIDLTLRYLSRSGPSLVFTNLVDFDSKYGHRNDPPGYAACVERFDARLPELLAGLEEGVAFVTGDHGCDPTTPSTDHSRETVPLLAAGLRGGPYDVGIRSTFADLGATVADVLGVATSNLAGTSFAPEIGL